MSLRNFHLVFIVASAALAIGFGAWLAARYAAEGAAGTLIGAIASFAAGVALVVYARAFVRKVKALH